METAIEWLRKQYHKVPIKDFGNLFDKAKEMEKQQILDAYNSGDQNGVTSMIDGYGMMDSEEYYNEMFKKEENGI